MMKLTLFLCLLVPIFVWSQQSPSPLISSFETTQQMRRSTPYGVEWIGLGPVVNSARVEAVQADPTRPGTMYAAFGSGNLWKTTNNGLMWKPIFEDQASLGIGDIALAPSDPNILYVGTGESLKKARNFTMPGTGIYRSDDAGETWRHLGLEDSWHIGEIAVHPDDPDIVVVAVLGHFWSPNPNRGLFRTENGGETWEHVLYVDDHTGANDIVFSPSHPHILYASLWENYPSVSGENSAVYRSDDGGISWMLYSKGLPEGPETGRIGLAVSHHDPDKVYALVDNRKHFRGEKGAAEVYQSVDGGERWRRTHREELMIFSSIGWYFADLYVNPQDDEEIFALGVRLGHSVDGGQTFDQIEGEVFHINPSIADGLHLDHCELWINPNNPLHLILGNDGGLYQTFDKGQTWTHFNNLPTGEFYDITVDNVEPYFIYGGVQDDATVYGPADEWFPQFPDTWRYLWIDAWEGGDGCMTFVDPEDANTVYFSMQHGATRRKDIPSGTSVSIAPTLPDGYDAQLQFNFVSPYILSPHNSRTLYKAGNYVFKSSNRGDNWTVISDNLAISANPDKQSLAAGALTESPLEPGLLFVGTDRGAFWISEDDGLSWQERSHGLPDAYVRSIFPSQHQRNRVYVAITGLNYDDLNCYLYRSDDLGETWELIQSNLPNEPANVIREDPMYENMLYAGLYRGVYLSLNGGESWEALGKEMPMVAISDLEIHEASRDLIAATHGRGIYKVNLSPLYECLATTRSADRTELFAIPSVTRPWMNDTHRDPNYRTIEKIPISFWLPEPEEVELKVLNNRGKEVWSMPLYGHQGLNQYRWDLITTRTNSQLPYFIHYDSFLEAGEYQVQLVSRKRTMKQTLTVMEGNRPPR